MDLSGVADLMPSLHNESLLQDDNQPTEGIHEELEIYVDSLESKEAQRFARQKEIDSNRTQQQRNRMGQFSTPFELARDIVLGTLSYNISTDIYFLEPALGTGVFFQCSGDLSA